MIRRHRSNNKPPIKPVPLTPPPSPIPTGKGTRSASNEPFARFLDRSTRVPALSLPGGTHQNHFPATVDLRSKISCGRAATSAREFGVVRVTGHGVSVAELRSVIDECGIGIGDETCLVISSYEIRDKANASKKIENFAGKLEAIAEQISQILLENIGEENSDENKKRPKKLKGSEFILSLHKFNHKNSMERNQLPLNNDTICLSLLVPFDRCQIYVQSEDDHFSFESGPETLVVTIGKQLEELSHNEFKCVSGKMIFVPAPEIRQIQDYYFCIEMKFSSSIISSCNVTKKDGKNIISIADQIVVIILITLIYKVFMFFIS